MTLGFHKTRTQNSLRVWFPLVRNGILVPSASSGDFTTYVIDSNDSGFISPSVSESTQRAGIYYFDITSSFFLASGTGDYNVSIEVNKLTSPKVNDVYYGHINVTTNDIDSISTTISEGINLSTGSIAAISASVWNAFASDHTTSGTFGWFVDQIFGIVNSAGVTISSSSINNIINGIWDESLSEHFTSGTTGWALGLIDDIQFSVSSSLVILESSGVTVASASIDTIVDAVWDELLNEHNISGSAGRVLSTAGAGGVDTDLLADAVWSRDAALNNVSGTMGWLQNKIFPMSSSLEKVRAMTCGRWIISGSQMIFYDEDNTTEVARFDLFDTEGDAFFSEPNAPAERVVV